MPGTPDNRAGSSQGRQRDEDQACEVPSGPGARCPNSEAGYTHAIRPCYGAFKLASPIGGSPYTLLGSTKRCKCMLSFRFDLTPGGQQKDVFHGEVS